MPGRSARVSWHGASYNMATGERIDGPAPAGSSLMVLSTRVDGDALVYVWGE
jgi:nitrite reductase/ring-hydroxylating ferredoxin subunit